MDMLLTDPPYNVALGCGGSYDEARKRHRRADGLVIANDDLPPDDFKEFLLRSFESAFAQMKSGAAFYIWHADNSSLIFRQALIEAGMELRQVLIWCKQAFTLGRQDFQWQHEPCLYGWKDGAAHKWYSDRRQSTLLHFDRPTRSEDHPTMKPVALFGYLIKCSTQQGDAVLDVFGGSGTTLIAAEQLGRRAYMMELDPKYVDVIIDRWEKLTGEKAVRIDGV